MITIPLTDIKAKIKEQSSLSEDDINTKIKEKLDQLSGLISEEGAAHIIANELGVKLTIMPQLGEKIKIKSVLPGMKNIEVVGKVTKKYELREFATEKRSGKLASFIISDETGFIRIVLWNDQTDKFNEINEGDTIKLEGGYVKDNNGKKEIHISETAKIELNPAGIEIKNVQESVIRKKLSELQDGDDNIETLATIVQVFDIRFFEVDPNTGKRAIQKEGKFYSGDKEITPDFAYVLNLFLDDGTENIRTVLWRNQIQKLLGMNNEEVIKFKDDPAGFETLKTDLLGTIVKVIGRVKKNPSFDRLELVANLIYKDVNPEEEITKLKGDTKTEQVTTVSNPEPTETKPTAEQETQTTTKPEITKEETKTPESETTPKAEEVSDTPTLEEETIKEEKEEDTTAVEEAVMTEEKQNSLSIDDLEQINN